MAKEDIDLLMVAGDLWKSDALRYCTGAAITEGLGVALVERGGRTALRLDTAAEAGRLAAENPGITVTASSSIFDEVRASAGGRRVGVVSRGSMPHGLASIDARDVTAMMEPLLLRKSPAETEAVRRASAMADEGYRVFREAARVGRAEYELVADVEAFFRSRGCPDNFQILGSGGVEVRGMHPPGERRLQAGDLVTTELTPCIEGYYAQICRTLVIGEPTPVQAKVFRLFNDAMEAGIDAVRPGTTAGAVARALNDVFREHGLGDYVTSEYTRVRGHALGLGTGQKPSLLEDVDMVLEPDMTLIVHPNTYHPDVGYFVHGDMLRVTETGCEVLCRTPRELFSMPCAAA